MGVARDGDAECSAQTQVCNLEGVGAVIHQQVLRLQISMHDSMLVTVSHTLEQLVHEVLHTKTLYMSLGRNQTI